MNAELARIERQLQASFEGEAWHGPSVLEALAGVTADVSRRHPIAGAPSIWDLVLHLAATYRLVLRRIKGDATPLAPDQDWPALPEPTEANWRAAVETLQGLNEELRRAVRTFRADKLDKPLITEPSYSAYVQFIGLTQHDLYHAGQIVLLKRASLPPV